MGGRFLANAFGVADKNSSEEILHKVRQGHNVTHHDMNNRSCQLFMLITCICAVSHSLDAQTRRTRQADSRTRQAERVYLCAKTRATFVRRPEVDERG